MQCLARNRAIVRWLQHRGGAGHHCLWAERGRDTPVAVVIGADPATMLSAVLPLPEGISKLRFSGVLRGARPRLANCITQPLVVPADAEIVLEGVVSAHETAPEGPYGDHTGYFNAVEPFPVMRITAITCREAPVYVTTCTGRPPDKPSVIGGVLNDLFVPILRRQLPEVVDCWLPPEACSYRIAAVSIRKRSDALDRLSCLAAKRYAIDDIGAAIASGSFKTTGMIVAPCSARTLSAIAAGVADNLLVRAADVHLKERRRLVLVARESPLHPGHLRRMPQVTEFGAIVAPPVPAFYMRRSGVGEIVDQLARRMIDLLSLDRDTLAEAWAGLD